MSETTSIEKLQAEIKGLRAQLAEVKGTLRRWIGMLPNNVNAPLLMRDVEKVYHSIGAAPPAAPVSDEVIVALFRKNAYGYEQIKSQPAAPAPRPDIYVTPATGGFIGPLIPKDEPAPAAPNAEIPVAAPTTGQRSGSTPAVSTLDPDGKAAAAVKTCTNCHSAEKPTCYTADDKACDDWEDKKAGGS